MQTCNTTTRETRTDPVPCPPVRDVSSHPLWSNPGPTQSPGHTDWVSVPPALPVPEWPVNGTLRSAASWVWLSCTSAACPTGLRAPLLSFAGTSLFSLPSEGRRSSSRCLAVAKKATKSIWGSEFCFHLDNCEGVGLRGFHLMVRSCLLEASELSFRTATPFALYENSCHPISSLTLRNVSVLFSHVIGTLNILNVEASPYGFNLRFPADSWY